MNAAQILAEIAAERERQDAKWGEQNHPDGTGGTFAHDAVNYARRQCKEAAQSGTITWNLILQEEMWEAFAESDPIKLRAELVQCAAVAVAWIEAIDRRA